jgi:hypothetical protein
MTSRFTNNNQSESHITSDSLAFRQRVWSTFITYHDFSWEYYIHLIQTFLILDIIIRDIFSFFFLIYANLF